MTHDPEADVTEAKRAVRNALARYRRAYTRAEETRALHSTGAVARNSDLIADTRRNQAWDEYLGARRVLSAAQHALNVETLRLTPCEICGTPLHEDTAEMYDTTQPELPSVLCHAQCGLSRGLDVA